MSLADTFSSNSAHLERGGSPDPPRETAPLRDVEGVRSLNDVRAPDPFWDPPRKSASKGKKRRAILAAAVRWPLAGGLALLAARLLARSAGGPLDPAEKCVNQGLCRGCRALGACRSPQAELFRQATGGTAGLPDRGDGGRRSARPDEPAVPQPSRSTERESPNGES
jgi:hypothetical protein